MSERVKIKNVKEQQVRIDQERSRVALTKKAGLKQIVVPLDYYDDLLEMREFDLFMTHERATEERESARRASGVK